MAKKKASELEQVVQIYKIAGTVLVALIVIGIIASLAYHFSKAPAKEPAPQVTQEVVEEVAQVEPQAPVEQNVTQNITQNTTQNVTQNVSVQNTTTQNASQQGMNLSVTKTVQGAGPKPHAPVNWTSMKIAFPDTLKRVPAGKNAYEYINITEGDGTPVTNGEQFELEFKLQDPQGRTSYLLPNYEREAWLLRLLLTNKGPYWLTVTARCEEKTGYCQRFYDTAGYAQNSFQFDVI